MSPLNTCLFSCQVFDNYAVTVMIGGEPYTLGLFDTAGEKPSAYVIVPDQDLLEVMLNMKTYNWGFFGGFFFFNGRGKSL